MKPKFFTNESKVPRNARRVDTTHSALSELYFEEHPSIPKGWHDPKELQKFVRERRGEGVWVYYPWLTVAVRIPSQGIFEQLRTARNKNLIAADEQERYREASVGIAGLSVGSSVLMALVATGGPQRLKLADPDVLEITNLNRIRARLPDVGTNKTIIAAHNAWELDPFLDIELWEQGVSKENLTQFIAAPKLSVFVDEMDAIELKFHSRLLCKKARVPVVMATDNGDSIILDVERFDLEPERPIFHGRVAISPSEMRTMTREAFVKLSSQIIDPAYFTERQQASIMEVGKTLASIPRIATAASLSGAAVAFAVRRITNGCEMPSGRYTMGCEPSCVPGYSSAAQRKERAAHTKKFIASFKRV